MLYLYIIVAGMFAEVFVRSRLIVSADAEATAANIIANESLFRIGFSGEFMHLACDVAVAVILYLLFRPVDRNIALLGAFLRLACDIILAGAGISHFAALRLLGDAGYLTTFQPDQLHTLALLAMKLHGDAYAISLMFFGFACLVLGYLIFRASYFPRLLGVLMIGAGLGYLVNSFVHFLRPELAGKLFPWIFVVPFAAELSLTLWLLVKGVDALNWQQRARSRLD
jgi:hypothetical protein